MSDARFASLKTDPRFRRPKKHRNKIVLDDRFKGLLGDGTRGKKNEAKKQARVDKYGRRVSETQETDDLRRFYRLEDEEEDGEGEGEGEGADGPAAAPTIVDYARGAVLMESSDEEEEDDVGVAPHAPSADANDSDSDEGGFVSLGADRKKLDEEDEAEIDLDENTIAALDAQVAEYANAVPEREGAAGVEKTKRLAVVNLDWDYVRAVHLYKIFSSLLSLTAPLASASISHADKAAPTGRNRVNLTRGRILSVRVYPSEFGKKRMAREEKEGPPTEVFRKKNREVGDEEINEKTIFDTGDEADYDEDALRKYQLERLRYYYAIVECDTVEATTHIYNELEGAELERSANVLDLSFVPDDMTFDDEPRDEATQPSDGPYRAVEFVTDALRHSKVKLTWDEDDPERIHVLRRPLTKKEVEDADFRAYVASSSSSEAGSEDEGETRSGKKAKTSKNAKRDKLRTLLLGGSDDELPEGWGNAFDNKADKARGGGESDGDLEVTFTPGLSETKNPEEETTIERYQRKKKERRKKKKEETMKRTDAEDDTGYTKEVRVPALDDEFFGVGSDSERGEEVPLSKQSKKKPTKPERLSESSKAELALLAASDNPNGEPAHFDMKAILKAEKRNKNKKSRHKSKKRDKDDAEGEPGETQEDFIIDVKDDRFAAIHEDHQFAIDPTNPQFKKTKSMTALLGERSRRQKSGSHSDHPVHFRQLAQQDGRSLQSLVESVKRKSTSVGHSGLGKRRKLERV